MGRDSIETVSGNVDEMKKHEVDLDEALSIAGTCFISLIYTKNVYTRK